VRSDSTRAAVDSSVSVSVSVSVPVDGVLVAFLESDAESDAAESDAAESDAAESDAADSEDAESDDDVPPSDDPPPEPSSATARAGPKAIAAPTPTPAAASRNHVVHDIARMASPITKRSAARRSYAKCPACCLPA
jgi:hypothetical protein